MKKDFSENITLQLIFLSLIIFISRLPFLWAGFGSEEDSWLLAITSKNIALTGNYELSRAPAHPLQEIIYSLLYHGGLSAFSINLLSAIASVPASIFFALTLKNIGFKHYLFAAFAFAFTPVVFIASTYTIDYMLAVAFVMGSFYFVVKNNFVLAGIFLGIAIGFRFTSGAMLIPFCILLFPISNGGIRRICLFAFTTVVIGFLTYIPVIKTYGLSFFTFADQFPYPNLPKIFYKATIGVFGTVGICAILFYKTKIFIKIFRKKEKIIPKALPKKLFYASCICIIIYMVSYLRLPQKSAYLIPIIPFVILLYGFYYPSIEFRIFCLLLTLSSFLFSMNLTDSIRGANYSPLAIKFDMAGQRIFLDPLTGPVFSDYTKRLNKIAYTEEVFQKMRTEQKKMVLICGWWYNELIVRNWDCEKNQNVQLVFYIDKSTMEKYISSGYEIYYLPEQNLYNDRFSMMNYTDSVAHPYL